MIDYTIAENEYGKYAVPNRSIHRPACQAVMAGKVYEPDTIHAIMKYSDAEKGGIVMGGVYFGDMLPAVANSFEGCVWAWEARPLNAKCAITTIAINKLDNVIMFSSALSDRASLEALMVIDSESGMDLGGGSYMTDNEVPSRSLIVSTCTLDFHLHRSGIEISLIHLDIEGHEEQAIKGGVELIKQNSPVLILETVPGMVYELGYEVVDAVHGNTILRRKHGQR